MAESRGRCASAAKRDQAGIVAKLIAELKQISPRYFIDVYIHHNFGAILVDAAQKVANQRDVLRSVAHGQAVCVFVRNDDRLRSADRSRQGSADQSAGRIRIGVGQIERSHDQLLELLTASLVGDQNRALIQFLKEQAFLQKDVIERSRGRYIVQVDIDRAWLSKRLLVEHHVELQVVSQRSNEWFQIAVVSDHAHLFLFRLGQGFLRPRRG